MNITQDTDEYFLYNLKLEIEEIVENYTTEKDKTRRKEMRKNYATLIKKYHTHTGIEVWNKTL